MMLDSGGAEGVRGDLRIRFHLEGSVGSWPRAVIRFQSP
jgi:hypothetical protein